MGESMRVLVIDNDFRTRVTLLQSLTRRGDQAVTATSVAEATPLLKSQQRFNCVILNAQLPEGEAWLRHLQKTQKPMTFILLSDLPQRVLDKVLSESLQVPLLAKPIPRGVALDEMLEQAFSSPTAQVLSPPLKASAFDSFLPQNWIFSAPTPHTLEEKGGPTTRKKEDPAPVIPPSTSSPSLNSTQAATSAKAEKVSESRFSGSVQPTEPQKLDPSSQLISVQKEAPIHSRFEMEDLIGRSPEMLQVMHLIEQVADTDSTILITGESGTGKELVAHALHNRSRRSKKPFVPVNCGAIPAGLLESELFGHTKGAFTGATSQRAGRFEMANNGTLFLDEIGEMDPNLQVKLLRILQERQFEPVGSTKTLKTNVRVIVATNIDLEQAVREKRFREDLFYRLNVIPIPLPALRHRCSDIPNLIHYFLKKISRTKGIKISGMDPEILTLLQKYSWPGNVRELENLMERLCILNRSGWIQVSDLPSKYQSQDNPGYHHEQEELPETGLDFNAAVEAFENRLILKALNRTSWNRNQAAKLLHLNRTTLVEKIKKKGLQPDDNISKRSSLHLDTKRSLT